MIDAVRQVYGGVIDLDPASSEAANGRVKARKWIGKSQCGLRTAWIGRNVFINPPYSRTSILRWAECAANHHVNNFKNNVIWLSNNSTETKASQTILQDAEAVCLPAKRMSFISPDGKEIGSSMQGQMIVLLSTDEDIIDRFRGVMERFGVVFRG